MRQFSPVRRIVIFVVNFSGELATKVINAKVIYFL
jgi:hypothetical protein